MGSKQRSIKNLFVQPQFQLRLSLYYVVVGGVILSVVGAVVLSQLGEVNRLMNSGASLTFQSQSQVNDLMIESLQYAFMGFGFFILFSFGFALITSHRIAGPQVAIKYVIEEMKLGNYEPNRNLRPNDELQEVMLAVKELAAVLKAKEGDKIE
tara:strand:- start:6836 stop:7294 length:459 start_codon:yes stop_codon:yes gene_type:complete